MSPMRVDVEVNDGRFPRVSGDEPGPLWLAGDPCLFSPRERG